MKLGSPQELAVSLLDRSVCAVQVAAVLEDSWGVFAWGWNSSGLSGYGLHAEAHAIMRANKDRLHRATLYVAAKRRKSQRVVTAKPCPNCQSLIDRWGIRRVRYRDGSGNWRGY